MKPLIGITASMELNQTHYQLRGVNVESITKAGGLPIMLPYVDEANINEMVDKIDGLYVTGGDDIDPTYFGEEPHPKLGTIIPARDQFEITIVKKMLSRGKPILGVCRGSQIINIAAGGNMYQDIYTQINRYLLQHNQKAPFEHGSHFVQVEEGTLLHQITGKTELRVNSFHHQANRNLPDTFQISGIANDGVIEAIESKDAPFVLGVQWHPELMHDRASMKIFEEFVRACK